MKTQIWPETQAFTCQWMNEWYYIIELFSVFLLLFISSFLVWISPWRSPNGNFYARFWNIGSYPLSIPQVRFRVGRSFSLRMFPPYDPHPRELVNYNYTHRFIYGLTFHTFNINLLLFRRLNLQISRRWCHWSPFFRNPS